MKVAFLDFDGVLNSAVFFNTVEDRVCLSPDLVDNLNKILDNTDCQVVVSSDWRRFDSVAGLQLTLESVGFKGQILGITPITEINGRSSLEANRVWEIHDWLNRHPDVDSWVAIDDMDLSALGDDHFVKTSFVLGLTEDLAAKAIRLLNQ